MLIGEETSIMQLLWVFKILYINVDKLTLVHYASEKRSL
jgi:hypothetical protein